MLFRSNPAQMLPAVLRAALAFDELLRFQPIEQPRHAGRLFDHPLRHLERAQCRRVGEIVDENFDRGAAGAKTDRQLLEALGSGTRVVLWFEHDLFDQLILIRLLNYFAGKELGARRITLITLHEFPGVTLVDPYPQACPW